MINRPVILVSLTLCILASPALAQSEHRPQQTTGQTPHGYWLSEGLNRLVFWKRPEMTRPRLEIRSE